MLSFLLDLPNFLVVILFVFLCYFVKLIPSWLALVLGMLSASPFLVNDVIFPASYMPDQFKYLNVVQHLRSFDFEHGELTTVKWAGWMFTFFPLPFVETIKSLGFFNRFAASALIVWLYAYKNIRNWPIVFITLYPSFVLYSSMSLRDTLILCLMILSLFSFVDGKKVLFVAFIFLLFIIKFQNALLLLIFALLHQFTINPRKKSINLFLLAGLTLLLVFYFQNNLIDAINTSRLAMFIEDGGDLVDFEEIVDLLDLIFGGLQSAVMFLLKPLPWEAKNLFQIIQSFENILLIVILFFIHLSIYKKNRLICIKYLLFLTLSFMVYGSIVSNVGTAARYKFTFVVIVVLGLYYESKRKSQYIKLPESKIQ